MGCGTAHHLQALSGYADQLTGIDPLPDTIEYARKKCYIKAGNVCLRVGGFEDLNNMDMEDFGLDR
ncbi:MAG: class I SAM-dependent methyltransferase [Actinomycetota bacterium]|nr:class I SAM-dependent methyltransferase [Actinomycetota bacterium]